MPGFCEVCKKDATSRCANCKVVYYCCKEHQKSNWKEHKVQCNNKDSKRESPDFFIKMKSVLSLTPQSEWVKGISGLEKYQWMMNCYRMRVDDLLVYQDAYTGLYDSAATKFSVMSHFWGFCKLALKHGVIIADDWNWKEFLNVAVSLISKPFSRADALQKYGYENIYLVGSGKRSLRHTGSHVYSSDVTSTFHRSTKSNMKKTYLQSESADRFTQNFERYVSSITADDFWQENNFLEVGGTELWRKFSQDMKLDPFTPVPMSERPPLQMDTVFMTPDGKVVENRNSILYNAFNIM